MTDIITETTDTTASVYQIDTTGRKNGFYRQSIWNSDAKFKLIYDGKLGIQKILRPADVVVEYNYTNDVLDGAYSITRHYSKHIVGDICENIARSRLEGVYKAGVKSGFEREYVFLDGWCLIREAHYNLGKLDGIVRKFDVDGNLMYSATFVGGLRHGPETHFTTDGGIWRANTWVHGRQCGA
ncbi:hypothetical protein F-VV10_0451 [Faustovirus]|nr:hypothetical protein F-VV10_0451 [Faustovirus]